MGEGQIAELLARYSYLALFGLLSAAGIPGLPISEDLLLIAGGAVAAKAGGSLPLMMLAGYAGVLAGDCVLFQIGRGLGTAAARQRRLSRVLTPERVARVRRFYERYGMLTVAVIRFTPGLRMTGILVSGSSGLPLRRFAAADALAAMISVPLLTWLGFRFGPAIFRDVKSAGQVLAVVILAVAAFLIARRVRHQRRGKASGLV